MSTFLFTLLFAISVARADTWVSGFIDVTQPRGSNLRTPCNNPNGTCATSFFELTPRLPNGNFSQILFASTQGEARHGVLKSYATAATYGTPYLPPQYQFPPFFPGSYLPGGIYAVGAASFSDVWTVTGGTPGTQGSMLLAFNTSGTFTTSGPGQLDSFVQFVGLQGRYNGTYNQRGYDRSALISVSGQAQIMNVLFPIIFGTPTTFTVQMQSTVSLGSTQFGIPYPVGASGTADAMHTGVLTSVVVKNSAGNVIPYQLTTQSGSLAYDNLGESPLVAATPEPATFGVAAAALGGMLLFRRRTR